jgi:hypothetical protein
VIRIRVGCCVFFAALGLALLGGSAEAQTMTDSEDAHDSEPSSSRAAGRLKQMQLGVDVGAIRRPAVGSHVSYGTGLAVGGHARVRLAQWLGLRLMVMGSRHSVTIRDGGLGVDGTRVTHPDLDTIFMASRLEPTWDLSRRVQVWAGPMLGWGRSTAPEPRIEGVRQVRTADRSGVMLAGGLEFGAAVVVIPNWLMFNTSFGSALMLEQSGSMFKAVQGFDQDGHRLFVDPLPKFTSSHQWLLGLSLLL